MASFKEIKASMDRVNSSKQMRAFSFTITLALTGVCVKRFRDKPSVWTALPLAKAALAFAETFKPSETRTS